MKNKDANVKKVLAARQFGVIFWDRNGCQSKMHYWNGEWAIVLDGIRQVRINIICITCSSCKKKSKSFTSATSAQNFSVCECLKSQLKVKWTKIETFYFSYSKAKKRMRIFFLLSCKKSKKGEKKF